jgi:predicted enzyme related to lactoylglutathione lyase
MTFATSLSPVSHWQILTSDPDGLAAFYAGVFGWTVSAANSLGYREISTQPGGPPDGGLWPNPPGAPELVQLFVEVADIDDRLAAVEAAGGRILFPKQILPDGDAMAMVLDPKGRPFGLMTRQVARE